MKKRFLPTKFDTFEHVTTCCLRNVCVTVHAVLDIWKECLNPDIYFLIKNQCTYTYHARIVWKRRVKFKFPLFSVNTPLTNRKWSTSGVCDNRCSVEACRKTKVKLAKCCWCSKTSTRNTYRSLKKSAQMVNSLYLLL